MNENVKMKSVTALKTVVGRKQLNFEVILFLVANELKFNQLIQLWRCLPVIIN